MHGKCKKIKRLLHASHRNNEIATKMCNQKNWGFPNEIEIIMSDKWYIKKQNTKWFLVHDMKVVYCPSTKSNSKGVGPC